MEKQGDKIGSKFERLSLASVEKLYIGSKGKLDKTSFTLSSPGTQQACDPVINN